MQRSSGLLYYYLYTLLSCLAALKNLVCSSTPLNAAVSYPQMVLSLTTTIFCEVALQLE